MSRSLPQKTIDFAKQMVLPAFNGDWQTMIALALHSWGILMTMT